MADENKDQNLESNPLGMSDEDFLKGPVPGGAAPTETKDEKPADGEAQTQGDAQADASKGSEADTGAAKDDDGEGDAAKDPKAGEGEADPAKGSEGKAPEAATEKKPETDDKSEVKPDEKKAETPSEIDYKAVYEKLTAPFKANGRDVKVDSVEDAIALMQMGANYNKKMAGLKPHLKLLKTLEGADLLSEEKIGYLIDLHTKNPAAINKLIKESGLNPMDLDADKANDYKPTIRTVDDKELALDEVLESIQDRPSFSRTVTVVQAWDAASKKTLSENPSLLAVMNDHIERGVYDIVQKEVEKRRMLGRLNGVSELEAYRQVGDDIQARGGFNQLAESQGKTVAKTPEVVEPKSKPATDDKLNEKRRAAATTKAPISVAATSGINPLSLSDEEFEKNAAKLLK